MGRMTVNTFEELIHVKLVIGRAAARAEVYTALKSGIYTLFEKSVFETLVLAEPESTLFWDTLLDRTAGINRLTNLSKNSKLHTQTYDRPLVVSPKRQRYPRNPDGSDRLGPIIGFTLYVNHADSPIYNY